MIAFRPTGLIFQCIVFSAMYDSCGKKFHLEFGLFYTERLWKLVECSSDMEEIWHWSISCHLHNEGQLKWISNTLLLTSIFSLKNSWIWRSQWQSSVKCVFSLLAWRLDNMPLINVLRYPSLNYWCFLCGVNVITVYSFSRIIHNSSMFTSY